MADDYVTNDQDIPVQDDIQDVEDPIDEGMANSDQQLGSSATLFHLNILLTWILLWFSQR
jgi:hypothetical protein